MQSKQKIIRVREVRIEADTSDKKKDRLKHVEAFKYLGSLISEKGEVGTFQYLGAMISQKGGCGQDAGHWVTRHVRRSIRVGPLRHAWG